MNTKLLIIGLLAMAILLAGCIQGESASGKATIAKKVTPVVGDTKITVQPASKKLMTIDILTGKKCTVNPGQVDGVDEWGKKCMPVVNELGKMCIVNVGAVEGLDELGKKCNPIDKKLYPGLN
ncbi:MAG: hypothetical protein ABII22_02315 [Candidatus Micrarchaeota archaeon]